MEKNMEFKKVLFGFDREDVINYISYLTDDFHKQKKEFSEKAQEVKNELLKLEESYNLLLEENASLKEKTENFLEKDKLNEEKSDIKLLIENLTESLNNFVNAISEDKEADESDEPVFRQTQESEINESTEVDVIDEIIEKYT